MPGSPCTSTTKSCSGPERRSSSCSTRFNAPGTSSAPASFWSSTVMPPARSSRRKPPDACPHLPPKREDQSSACGRNRNRDLSPDRREVDEDRKHQEHENQHRFGEAP